MKKAQLTRPSLKNVPPTRSMGVPDAARAALISWVVGARNVVELDRAASGATAVLGVSVEEIAARVGEDGAIGRA